MIFIGIDPGLKGGIAVLDLGDDELPTKETVPILHRMPLVEEKNSKGEVKQVVDVHALNAILLQYVFDDNVEIDLEHIWNFASAIGQGGNDFAKAEGYGETKATVKLSNIPYRLFAPKTWQAILQCPKFDKTDAGRKARKAWIAAKMIEVFPKAEFIPKRCRVPQDGLTDSAAMAWCGAQRRYMEKFGGKRH